MSEFALSYKGIRKSFFGVEVLKGVSFDLAPGRVLGLVGENGAGKSTMMNLLGGVLQPSGGSLELAGQPYAPKTPLDARAKGVAFIHQELNLFSNLSVAENIFISELPRRWPFLPFVDQRIVREKTAALLKAVELDVSPDTLVEALSPGERQLVEIAKALSIDARVVIFDEPTTSLTARETERLFALIEKLRAEGRAIIYISHALEDVMRLCDDIVVLRDGSVVGSGTRETFTIARMVSLMVGRSLEQMFPERKHEPQRDAQPRLSVRGLSQPGVVENISFDLLQGEVLGVAGLMGSGRSELARILFGLDPCSAGEVQLSGQPFAQRTPSACIERGMAFLTESRREEGLMMDAPIRDNAALAALKAFSRKPGGFLAGAPLRARVDEVSASVSLAQNKISGPGAVKTLSGGNQQKVVLAKWLLTKPKVLILDEPTRGIDVGAKLEIYMLIEQLVAGGTSVLVISSELEELIGLCDRILVMSRGEIAGQMERKDFDREEILKMALSASRSPGATGPREPSNAQQSSQANGQLEKGES